LLRELFRVAKRSLVLFEPSYEDASSEGRARMESLGYVKGLENAIADCGGKLLEKIPIKRHTNPLNPTYAFVVALQEPEFENVATFHCPRSHELLSERKGFLWSPEGMLAYPVYDGIPILKSDNAVILTNP
jgi:uncharacterized protein YbaR (Trm112 family)